MEPVHPREQGQEGRAGKKVTPEAAWRPPPPKGGDASGPAKRLRFGEGSYRQYVETLISHYNEVVTLPVNNGDWQGIHVIGSPAVKVEIKPEQIFAWEVGNELQVDAPHQAVAIMQGFIQDMACFIREVDHHPRLVASGFVSTFHATNGQSRDPAQLYDLRCADGRAVFDLGTVHGYNNQWSIPRAASLPDYERNFGDRLEQYVDYRWFAAHGLPFLMEELGFTGGNHLQADVRHLELPLVAAFPLAHRFGRADDIE